MAKRTEVFTIGGDTYRITHLGTEEGKRLYRELFAHAGKLLEDKMKSLSSLSEAQLSAQLPLMLMSVLTQLPIELQDRLDSAFAKTTELQAAGQVWLNMAEAKLFDDHFAGRYTDALVPWTMTCIKFNFLGFLGSGPKQPSSGEK